MGVISPDFIPTISLDDAPLEPNFGAQIGSVLTTGDALDADSVAADDPTRFLDLVPNSAADPLTSPTEPIESGSIIDIGSIIDTEAIKVGRLEPTDSMIRLGEAAVTIDTGTSFARGLQVLGAGGTDVEFRDDNRLSFETAGPSDLADPSFATDSAAVVVSPTSGQSYDQTRHVEDRVRKNEFYRGLLAADADEAGLAQSTANDDRYDIQIDGGANGTVVHNTNVHDTIVGGADLLDRISYESLTYSDGAVPIDDPGAIPLPAPEADFLPVESSPAPNPGSIASSMDGREQGEARRVARSQGTTESSSLDNSASYDHSRFAGAVALSRDHYFAGHQGREPIAWSAHTAASQMRRHVNSWAGHTLSASNQPRRMPGAWDSIRLTEVADRLVDASLASFGSSHLEWAASQVMALSSVQLAASHDHSAKPVMADDDPAMERIAPPVLPRNIRELLLAQHQPLTVLVGVSLVSAHLIADSQTSRRKGKRGERGER